MLPLLAVACLVVVEAPRAEPDSAAAARPIDSESGQQQGSQENSPEAKSPEAKKTDFSIVRKPAFLLLSLGLAIGYLGLFAPFFYVSAYAVAEGVSSSVSFYLISILNAASLFGRVLPGIWADRWGHFNFMIFALGASAIVGFCWTAATNMAGLVVWSVVYGFTSGVSHPPRALPHLIRGLKRRREDIKR
jgi:predicted MFS family arabinose efflux permease